MTVAFPSFSVPVIKMRQPDGSIIVRAGRPEMVDSEVSIAVFNKETGVSRRYIAQLCEQGLIQHRRLTPKKDSKILIPRSEIARFLKLSDDDPKMPQDVLAGVETGKNKSNAPSPSARLGSPGLSGVSNPISNPKKP
jgi:hypothetical protein